MRVVDGTQWDTQGGRNLKSSAYETGGNAGIFIDYELTPGKTTDAHEFGHGLDWFEAGECDNGKHDCTIDNGKPGIMTARGVPVADEYGYSNQPSGARTVDTKKRAVLKSDVDKVAINKGVLSWISVSNVGKATNTIFGENGLPKANPSASTLSGSSQLIKAAINSVVTQQVNEANK